MTAVLFLALLLLLPQSLAAADNYTSRSVSSEPAEPEPPAAAASPALPEPAAPVPGTDSRSREVPGTGTELSASPAPASVPPPTVPAAPAGPSAPKLEKVWLDGKLPEGAQAEGEWVWSGGPAGGEGAVHSHPPAKGMQSHRFTGEPVEMPGNGMLVQQVWLDPQDPPQGIALHFTLGSGEKVGVYWEGEKEVFTPTEYEELWYYGMLPELGRGISLEILAEDLGFEDSRIAGITFATFDGRALWGKTLITEAPPLEGEEEASPEPISDIRVTG